MRSSHCSIGRRHVISWHVLRDVGAYETWQTREDKRERLSLIDTFTTKGTRGLLLELAFEDAADVAAGQARGAGPGVRERARRLPTRRTRHGF